MPTVVESWQQAQQLVAAGTPAAARPHYEAILAACPWHVPARLRMSRLEQAADDYIAARDHVLQAATLLPPAPVDRNLAYLTARLLEFAAEDRVAALVLEADHDDPQFLRQLPALAQHLWLAGRYTETLDLLDRAGRRLPPHPLLELTRANVLRYLGRAGEAMRHYESALALDPRLADAHWALATHAPAEPAMSRVPRLRQALAAASGWERVQLEYALFHELDRAGGTEQAWEALDRGAALARATITCDPALETAALEALMPAGALPEPRVGVEGPCSVFVVGMPRTGTTLLERILGNHPQVRALGERNDLAAAISEVSGRFFRHGLQPGAAALLASVDAAAVGRRYLQRIGTADAVASHLVDKNPMNLSCIPLVLRALPRARIVCLRREPMDACFSNLKELFQGGAYPYSYVQHELAAHCLRVHRLVAAWQAAAPWAVRVVDYEALARDPAASAAELLDFLGLPPQPGVEDVSRNHAPVATASSSQVREGVHARAIGAWRRYAQWLHPLQQALEAGA